MNTSSSLHHKKVKPVTTLRKNKEVDSEEEMLMKKITRVVPLKYEDSLQKEKKENSPWEYILKTPFTQRLPKAKKGSSTAEIMEIFKQVSINIPLLNAIKQMPSYAKFLKDLCTKKRTVYAQKKAFLAEIISSILQYKIPSKYKKT